LQNQGFAKAAGAANKRKEQHMPEIMHVLKIHVSRERVANPRGVEDALFIPSRVE
jgi:hypothetical protein